MPCKFQIVTLIYIKKSSFNIIFHISSLVFFCNSISITDHEIKFKFKTDCNKHEYKKQQQKKDFRFYN